MSTERYTFINFCLDFISINRLIFGGNFMDAIQKSGFVIGKIIDYIFYNFMIYIRKRYEQGQYRLEDRDYDNKDYVVDKTRTPYANIMVGVRPLNYTYFFYLILKLAWYDLMTYLQRNPIVCLVLYVIYNWFPLTTYMLYFFGFFYVIYSMFDR